MTYPNPPRTWIAANILTAAQLNAELRDALNIIIPTASTTLAWASYTPTLTQSATVTKTVNYAKYFQVGKIVVAEGQLALTGAGTSSNSILIGLPITAAYATTNLVIGSGYYVDASPAGFFGGIAAINTTTTFGLLQAGSGFAFVGSSGSPTTLAVASGDAISFKVIYEAA